MEFNPKVSIVIPVYNGANYLAQAIDSALGQTYKNIEIIVVNDGSKDDGATEKVALSYGNKIRYILKDNGGVASALNLGIKEMAGDYFTWLSHDDLLYPDKTAKQVQILSALQDKDSIIYSDYDLIDENSNLLSGIKHRRKPVVPDNTKLGVRFEMVPNNTLFFCGMLVPKKCFSIVGLFDETSRTCQDYEMCFRLAGKFRFIHQHEKMAQNRVHHQQVSLKKTALLLDEFNRMVSWMISELSKDSQNHPYPSIMARYFLKLALELKKRNLFESAQTAYDSGKQWRYQYGILPSLMEGYYSALYTFYLPYLDPLYWLRCLKRLVIK